MIYERNDLHQEIINYRSKRIGVQDKEFQARRFPTLSKKQVKQLQQLFAPGLKALVISSSVKQRKKQFMEGDRERITFSKDSNFAFHMKMIYSYGTWEVEEISTES